MQDPETTTTFAGLDSRTDTQLPTWYTDTDDQESVTFREAVRQLPRATETTVAYRNPYTEEWVETERFNAVVEPTRLVAHADDDTPDPLFHVPTESYAVINPMDVYGPLEDILETTDVDETPLSELIFGEIRQYRGGGEIHMDVMFDGLEVMLPGERDPITMGVTTGYDFFGNNAVYVEGFARDTACANSIRALTDRQTIKHVGDVGDFESWWRDILGQLELVADDLHGFIQDAEDVTIDFTDVPFDVQAFYTLLDFPEYLAERAAEDAQANATDPFEIDMWTLHSGATYALTHFFRGKEGDALDRYVRVANDILFNPGETLERVEREYEQRAAAETGEEGQTGIESQVALAQIEQVSESIREKAETFEEREQALRDRFATANSG